MPVAPTRVEKSDRIFGDGLACPAGPGRVLAILAMAASVTAILGSGPLLGWSEHLADKPGLETLQATATQWNDVMAARGLTEPYAALRRLVRHLEQGRYGASPHE